MFLVQTLQVSIFHLTPVAFSFQKDRHRDHRDFRLPFIRLGDYCVMLETKISLANNTAIVCFPSTRLRINNSGLSNVGVRASDTGHSQGIVISTSLT